MKMTSPTTIVLLLLSVTSARAQWWSWLDVPTLVSSIGASWSPESQRSDETPHHPHAYLSTVDLLAQFGRTAQVHHVTTTDGYKLELHRVPHEGGTVVLVNHGVLCSSADWVIAGPSKALGLILADAGYDVWLGNFRGNRYSNKHVNLSSDSLDYWDFSFHEMGMYDLPAEIDYILQVTGQDKLHYVGFSMGVAAFLVMVSERPEYNDKVRSLVGMAPAAYMTHTRGPFYRLASMSHNILKLGNVFGWGEFMTSHSLLAQWGQRYCEENPIYQDFCSHVIFLVTGYNSPQFNKTLLPIVLDHIPAGASTKTMIHFVQGISSGKFRQFDDSVLPPSLSLWQPPDYQLSRLAVPTLLLAGTQDWIVNNTDVEQTYRELSGAPEKQLVIMDDFNHMDFLFAINASTLLYSKVLDFLGNHTVPLDMA